MEYTAILITDDAASLELARALNPWTGLSDENLIGQWLVLNYPKPGTHALIDPTKSFYPTFTHIKGYGKFVDIRKFVANSRRTQNV